MKSSVWLRTLVLVAVPMMTAAALFSVNLHQLNRQLAGCVVDYTCNHGCNNRIWSEALQQPRDLYVYLPPGFDPHQQYPLVIFLHGILADEQSLLQHAIRPIDRAIACGLLPPLIIAAPDGSLHGQQSIRDPGSFFINSRAGRFEDWIMVDVWNFMVKHYPIRPERETHVLAGVSMGGFGVYNLGFKHRDRFRILIGVMPVLNLRWVDCCGNYMGNFHPECWGWRTRSDNPYEVLGSFMGGLVKIRMRKVIYPIFGTGPEALAKSSHENPIEMLDRLDVQPGELDMFIGYAGQDEFNLDAHAESFLHVVHRRGMNVAVDYRPNGRHNVQTGMIMAPSFIGWLNERLCEYERKRDE